MYLLKGKITLSLRCNPTIVFLVLLLSLLYIENIILLIWKKVHILPRKTTFWLSIILLFNFYYIIRNYIPAMFPI